MAPFPDEIDVFSVPHSRMKRLVEVYSEKLICTDFSDYSALESLLHSLHRTFCEFKCHEQIENQLIMTKLKKKLKTLSIHDSSVCNCHSDNRLSDMLALVHDGYSCTNKSESERLNYGLRLRHALLEFTDKFLPHMKEEEEVFQPMLIQYFGYEELKTLKELVIQEHSKRQARCSEEKCWSELENNNIHKKVNNPFEKNKKKKEMSTCKDLYVPSLAKSDKTFLENTPAEDAKSFADLPEEILLDVFSRLTARDLSLCGRVCRTWYSASRDPTLWRELLPVHWARGQLPALEDNEKSLDEDADFDESSSGNSSSEEDASSASVGSVRKETALLSSLAKHLLPVVGAGVRTVVLATSKALNNRLLRTILKHCPNVQHLDVSYTQTGDAAFKGWANHEACSSLEHVDLSGCSSMTDVGLVRLAQCLLLRRETPSHDADPRVDVARIWSLRGSSSDCDQSAWDVPACAYKEEPFRTSGLRFLNLSGCFKITDDGLLFLTDQHLLSRLEYLDVSGCFQLTGGGLGELMRGAPRLLPENLFYCDYVDGGPFQESANGCQNLQCVSRACCRSGE
ncbi:F-box/leucine rich repeat protein, putative [Ixodes scapularis]|uniref:F-box/leucine rich repeat protein, putative n=1 Tax=Ixodes scapularis TaxID=6945 RepID=B7P7F0_IXOSC|nr:F-box/leucine rich repeat protein, putative [Ixodes scapularis]|eukprot:XP_002410080.1 F-box/leucine rich repeat protein, putative [Ixodes scapularis]